MLSQRGRISGTLLFTLIVIGLAAYVFFFEYKKGQQDEIKKKEAAVIFAGLELSQVSGVTVKPNHANSESDIVLERIESGWSITKPVNDLADKDAVETYVSTLLEEKAQDSLGTDVDLKTLGLDQPKGGVLLKAGESTHQINIGTVKAYDGSLYATVSNKPGVQLVSLVWDSLLNKKPSDFRSKRLERSRFENWSHVRTKVDGVNKVELIKKSDEWELVPKSEIPVDAELVKGFITQMVTLEIQDFLAETKTDLARYGLLSPRAELFLSGDKDNKPVDYKLSFSNKNSEKDFANAVSSDFSGVAKVHAAILDVVSRPREYFYDRKFPFQYDVTHAHQLKIHTPQLKLSLVKKDNKWIKIESSNQLEVDDSKIDPLLAALSRLNAAQYLKEQGIGLNKNSIEVRNEKNELLTKVSWGDEYKPKKVDPANIGLQFYYAQTSKLPEQVLAIKQHLIHDLNLNKLFIEPTTETSNTPAAAPASTTKENL